MSAQNTTLRVQRELVRRVCATCATWHAVIMECRGVPGEAAPPDAGCDGWAKARRNDHWVKHFGKAQEVKP